MPFATHRLENLLNWTETRKRVLIAKNPSKDPETMVSLRSLKSFQNRIKGEIDAACHEEPSEETG